MIINWYIYCYFGHEKNYLSNPNCRIKLVASGGEILVQLGIKAGVIVHCKQQWNMEFHIHQHRLAGFKFFFFFWFSCPAFFTDIVNLLL